MKKISVVLPCHNEAKNLPEIVVEISKNIPKKYSVEIICIDDGSTDKTRGVIKTLSNKHKNLVKGIILHRNFGHQMALIAGIDVAKGDAIITMDADFQHPPELLKKAINKWEGGSDLVIFQKRKDKSLVLVKKVIRSIGYKVWDWVSDGTLTPGVSDFRLMDKKVANYIKVSDEREMFLRGAVTLAANNTSIIKYSVGKRRHGKSSYSLKMLLNMFITGFISFSTKPLRIASIFGLIIAVLTSVFLTADIVRALLTGESIIEGFITLTLLMLILNGFIIFYLGILGEYLGVVFREVKKRPKYLIDEKINI